MRQSEFGAGYATCLLMFTFHEPRLDEYLSISSFTSPSSAVELWANGATDHLYDLKTGGRLRPAHREAARRVQSVGLEMGHGFTGKQYTEQDARDLLAEARRLLIAVGNPETLDEALAVDRKLGLRADRGQWSCSQPLKVTA